MVGPQSDRSKKKRPGRPPASELEERNSRLLDAATGVFLEAGFGGASMGLIAKHAGASLQTLYSRYPSKSELFAALIERKATEVFEAVGPFSPQGSVEETLLRFSSELLAMLTKPETRSLHRLVIAESLQFPELGRIFWEGGHGRGLAALKDYLSQQRASGVLRVDDPDRAAEIFMSMLVGESVLRSTLGMRSISESQKEQRAWAQTVVSTFLASVRS